MTLRKHLIAVSLCTASALRADSLQQETKGAAAVHAGPFQIVTADDLKQIAGAVQTGCVDVVKPMITGSKKNLANQIFGFSARCEFLSKIIYIDPKNLKLKCKFGDEIQIFLLRKILILY